MKVHIQNRQRQRPLNKARVLKTAGQILTILEQTGAELSILFVGPRKMTELNRHYRGLNKSTDVLSFEAGLPVNNTETGSVLGDIVINVSRAESQAEDTHRPFYHEITRLLIHGTLHLLGYEHVNTTAYRAEKMRKKEREIFDAVTKMD